VYNNYLRAVIVPIGDFHDAAGEEHNEDQRTHLRAHVLLLSRLHSDRDDLDNYDAAQAAKHTPRALVHPSDGRDGRENMELRAANRMLVESNETWCNSLPKNILMTSLQNYY